MLFLKESRENMSREYMIRICNDKPQAKLIVVGDVVSTGKARGVVIAVANRQQYKVLCDNGDFEDWINPTLENEHHEIYKISDLIRAFYKL